MKKLVYQFASLFFIFVTMVLTIAFCADILGSALAVALLFIVRWQKAVIFMVDHISDTLENLNELFLALSDEY